MALGVPIDSLVYYLGRDFFYRSRLPARHGIAGTEAGAVLGFPTARGTLKKNRLYRSPTPTRCIVPRIILLPR